jgi:hypothetical protein
MKIIYLHITNKLDDTVAIVKTKLMTKLEEVVFSPDTKCWVRRIDGKYKYAGFGEILYTSKESKDTPWYYHVQPSDNCKKITENNLHEYFEYFV